MVHRTHNLLKSKAQFFILSAFVIVTFLYFISRWIEPLNVIDTSQFVLVEDQFVFNNIRDKTIATVKISKDCQDLSYNLNEYKAFVQEYAAKKNMALSFNYVITQPCDDTILNTSFAISISSPNSFLNASFIARK